MADPRWRTLAPDADTLLEAANEGRVRRGSNVQITTTQGVGAMGERGVLPGWDQHGVSPNVVTVANATPATYTLASDVIER